MFLKEESPLHNKINFNDISTIANIKKIIKDYPEELWDWGELTNAKIKIEECIPFTLIEKSCNNWDYQNLSYNPNLTKEFILKHPDKNWNIKYLIKNNKITDFNTLSKFKNMNYFVIEKYPDKSWDWEWLIENTNINIEKYIPLNLIEKYCYKWDYYSLSKNPNITENFILKYPNENWDIDYLIKNNKITNFKSLSRFKYANSNWCLYKNIDKPWDWEWLFKNTTEWTHFTPIDMIDKYLHNFNYSHIQNNNNITEEFILKHPDKSWDINKLIKNNKITDFKALSKFKYITSAIDIYPDKPWDWEWLIENTDIDVYKYIPLELIEKYKNKWKYNDLKYNPNFTEEFILKYPNKKWDINYLIENNKITDFKALSKFKYISSKTLYDYPDKPWDWEWLIENTDINVEDYISLDLTKKYKNKWDYNDLSKIPNLTEEFILKYPYQNWDIEYLIENNKITDFKSLSNFKYINHYIINKYLNNPWDWDCLIENNNIYIENCISLDLIEKYKNILQYNCLHLNPNITEEFILKYPNKNWNIEYLINNNKINFKALSKFKNINQKIIDKYPNKSWDWEWLIENTNIHVEKYIPFDIIEKYISIALIKKYIWDWKLLSKNPNITEEFTLKYSDKINKL